MIFIESLKTILPKYNVYSENDMVCVKSGDKVLIQLCQTHCVGIFSFNNGTIIVRLLDPELPDYNDKMMLLISQILTNRGIVSNYRGDFSSIRALFVQVESPEILEISVSHLGGILFSSEHMKLKYDFTKKDVVSISKFFADPENYKFGRHAIYCWNKETNTLFEEFQWKLFTAGPCETPDDNSLFEKITLAIYQFRYHVREMRMFNVRCLTENNMVLHLHKSYNTTEQLESANKKRLVEFCNLDRETFSPILLQEKDLSDVEEETGDDTPSLEKQTRS
jgi:hypothetical protein